jgi:hypothetical protein
MTLPRFSKWPWLFVLLAAVASCNFDDLVDPKISGLTASPTIALPLGFGELSINDLLSDADSAFIKVYETGADKGVLYLYYEETLETQGISDLIELPDKNVTRGFRISPVGSAIPIPPSGTEQALPGVGNQSLTFDLGLDPEKVTEVLFTSGTLRISATTSKPTPGLQFKAVLTLPSFKKNNVELQQTLIGPNGTPVQLQMAGYLATMNDNIFDATVAISVLPTAGGSIPADTRFNVTLDFGGLDYDYFEGFFGNDSLDLPSETLEIGAFDNVFEDVEVSLAAPRISFDVISKYGIPVTVKFKTLEAQNDGGSLAVELSESPVRVASPPALGDSTVKTVFVTNAQDLLDFAPTRFSYTVNAEINDRLTTGNNFIDKESDLKVRMKVEVPFIGSATNIILGDTLDVDLSDIENSDIESALLKIKASNQLPINATLQLYLVEDDFTLIGTLLAANQSILVGAETSADGTPTEPGIFDDEIALDKTKLSQLFKAKKIIIEASISTSDNPKNVKFRADDKLKIELGLQATVNLNVDLD